MKMDLQRSEYYVIINDQFEVNKNATKVQTSDSTVSTKRTSANQYSINIWSSRPA